jgi:hypothetical protein
MIVSERNVSDALAYLSQDPHPLALARKDVTDAENNAKRAYAEAFITATGSVDARRAAAEIDPLVATAKEGEGEAMLAHERHKARVKAAEMLIEVWRTENANIRAAERVR